MRVLVTGNAGFIGFHLTKRLLEQGRSVVGVDSVNDYYDPNLKEQRLNILANVAASTGSDYQFLRGNLADAEFSKSVFATGELDRVFHLAAQAGVRYSLVNPQAYVESNIVAFTNVIEGARYAKVPHFIYASTSSVYGANTKVPFAEDQAAVHPLQFYAATKRANELMAHSYSHLFGLPTTGLRFFTVYGHWGRPDMALFLFTKNILAGEPIQVFNYGNHTRDFTFVEDIVDGILGASANIAQPDPTWNSDDPDPATSNAPFRVINIGNNNPIDLSAYISAIESTVGKTAIKELLPLQAGDVPDTYADVSRLIAATGYKPATPVQEGVARFVEWYRGYYGQ